MDRMTSRPAFSFFVDRREEPSYRRFLQVLAQARPAWDDLDSHLKERHVLKGFLHFMYGKQYGWALCFRRSGRFIAAMYPNRGFLTVQIILNNAEVETAKAMGLPPRIARVLEAAKDYPEGRWLFVPVKSRKDARDLRALIELKFLNRKSARGSSEASTSD